MTDTALLPQKSSIWWIFLLQGFAGIILGLMLVTEPAATVVALTTFLGFYWLILGLLGLVADQSMRALEKVLFRYASEH